MRSLLATFLAVLLCACPQQQGTPAVNISAHPFAIDDMGQSTTLDISAVDALGNPGTGTVTLSSAAGTAADTSVKLDASGSATSKFSCNVTSDAKCSGRVGVTASWNGQTATTRVQVGDAGLITGTGGGTSAGGGTATGGGMGGGGPDSGMGGGGSEPDGGPDSGTGGGAVMTDGGGPDAGPEDAGPPAAFDAGSVLLVGSLTPGAMEYAAASLSKPTSALVGVPAGTDVPSAQLNAAGQLVYYDPTTVQLNVVVPDDYGMNGTGSSYPADPEANDQPIVDITPCGQGGLTGFWTRPDSMSVVFQCSGDAGSFEDTTPLRGLSGFRIIAAGFHSSLLILDSMDQGYTADDAGHHPVFGFTGGETMASLGTNDRWREVRATDGGYWVMRASMNNEGTGPCDLYFVSNAGTATFLGLFSDLNVGTSSLACTGRMDSAGVLYTPVQISGGWAVQRRPNVLAGSTSTVYTTVGAPNTSYATFPPHVFTFFDSNSSLVTGP